MIEHEDPMERLYDIIGSARKRPSGKPGRKSNMPDKAELEKAYIEQGLTIKAVGERFGVSESAVYGWLNQCSIPRRPRGGSTKKEVRTLMSLPKQDVPDTNVGEIKEEKSMPMVVEEIASIEGTNDNIYAIVEEPEAQEAQSAENVPDTKCPAISIEYISLECGDEFINVYKDKIEIDTAEYSFEEARNLRALLDKALSIDITKMQI